MFRQCLRRIAIGLLFSKMIVAFRVSSRVPFSTNHIRRSLTMTAIPVYGGSGVTRQVLSDRVRAALVTAFGPEAAANAETMVLPGKPEFGDYQCNAAMPLAKQLKMKPRDIAEKLRASLQVEDIVGSMDISGPGFINIHLSDSFVKNKLTSKLRDPSRLGIAPVPQSQKQRVIVDFSSPNIAKEMHVGHLRSTIIGDTLSRILEFLGHDVLRLNHVGDWGTQFGMLIKYLQEQHPNAIGGTADAPATIVGVDIGDLVEFYKAAKKRFDDDPVFQEAARAEVVRLQGGDETSLRAWRAICDLSRLEFQKIYDMLEVRVNERGESFYNPLLPSLVEELEGSGLAVQSEGATCVFLPGYNNPDGTPQPLIVRKSDGGFLYATTDLAAIRQRSRDEKADRVLYVTDIGQSQHFDMVFKAARAAKLVDDKTELRHVPFGLVQGEDGKKFKTRSGDTVKLKDLLNEAVKIAEDDMMSRLVAPSPSPSSATNTDSDANRAVDDTSVAVAAAPTITAVAAAVAVRELTAAEKESARIVGLGAVKYADLSMNRESNYRFSYKKMLSLQGNTAPYMLYAYARIQGIRRKAAQALKSAANDGATAASGSSSSGGGSSSGTAAAEESEGELRSMSVNDIELSTPEEKMLVKQLLRLDEILDEVSRDLYPNKMCEYLFELSQRFNQFYERCPVLKAETPAIQKSRAALCALTADTLKLSLGLLGINTVERL